MASLLFVDDEEPLRRAVRGALGRKGHTVRTASSLARAIRCLELYRFDGIFVDVWLGDESGFDLLSWIENHEPRLARRIVFVTGDIMESSRENRTGRALGLPVVAKPFQIAELEKYVAIWDAGPPYIGGPRVPPI
jgi:DNA-binding NtrC family response regulator